MKSSRWPTGCLVVLALTFLAAGSVMGQSAEVPEVLHMKASVGDVEFPHLEHIEDMEIECTECHHATNAAALDTPHDQYFDGFWIDCKSCHIPGAGPMEEQACSNCHHHDPQNISDQTLSAKVVIHKTCWKCHEVETGPEASAACGECHVREAK